MFLAETLTALTEGLKRTFTTDYPVEDFAGPRMVGVSIEYPIEAVSYPAVWVGFEPVGNLSNVGIGHTEVVTVEVDGEERFGEVSVWRFEGRSLFTIMTQTSLNRARLMDEVTRVIAFGHLEEGRGAFRQYLIDQDLIRIQLNYDEISITGMAETPGTPWGTDDIVYEVTLSVDTIGEFASTPFGQFVPLSAIKVIPIEEGTPDPTTPGGWI